MAGENREERSLLERLRHNYRLVVMNNETFEEVGSYNLSLLNVYVMVSMIVVVVALLVGSVIVFTPVRQYIPGYGDLTSQQELQRMNRELETLEAEVEASRAYNDNIRKILVGETIETEADVKDATDAASADVDTVTFVDPIEEDEALRKEIENQELESALALRAQTSSTDNFGGAQVPLEQLYFTPPLTGIIGAAFNLQKKHYGVDIIAPSNTSVKSVLGGYVFLSDWTLETGNTIGIQHAHNLVSFYKHNSALLKKVGSYVKAGEAVAIIGNTGELTDGPHLHFELWHNGKAIDPAELIIFE